MSTCKEVCPCGYLLEDLDSDKCIECGLFPCDFIEDDNEGLPDQAFDIGEYYSPEYTDSLPSYYNSLADDSPDPRCPNGDCSECTEECCPY